MKVQQYATLIFDCDGVVLDSNRVKTDAFRQAGMPYGTEAAEALVDHHVANGGISRYAKFEYFLSKIVGDQNGPGLEQLLASYASELWDRLLTCDTAAGLDRLRAATPDKRWLVVSGGDQDELRAIFEARGLYRYFDGGIFGSPDSKETILRREIRCGNIQRPALFMGDSRYDFEAAQRVGLDFVFVSGWTEFPGWEQFVKEYGLPQVNDVGEMIDSPFCGNEEAEE